MPSYKHISKKANRRRRRQFESSLAFRVSLWFNQGQTALDKAGRSMAAKAVAALAKWINGRYAGACDRNTLYKHYNELTLTHDEAWTHLPMIDRSTGILTDRIELDQEDKSSNE